MHREPEAKNTQVTLKPWITVLQVIVPVFLFILGVYIRQVDTNIANVRTELADFKDESCVTSTKQFDMIFKHMTNDEMHSPRSMTVSKPEFTVYQQLRNEQMKEIRDSEIRIQYMLEKHLANDK